MIQSFLFCNGYGRGYREICADNQNKELRNPVKGEMPSIVSKIWNHTGTNAIGGFSEGKYYFIVKDIEILRDKMKHDDQGRKICMNLAFTADEEYKPELALFIRGFLHNYIVATSEFAEAFTFASNIAGYELNFEIWEAVIKKCIASMNNTNDAIEEIRFADKNLIQFLFLKFELEDFRTQTEIKEPIGRIFSANEYKKIVVESTKDFSINEGSLKEHINIHHSENEKKVEEEKISDSMYHNNAELTKKDNQIEILNVEIKREKSQKESLNSKLLEEQKSAKLLQIELEKSRKSKGRLIIWCLTLSIAVILLIIYIIFKR